MPDFRVDTGLVSHPKTIKLMRRCGDRAFFCLLTLWAWAAANRTSGTLSGLDGEDVEIVAGWGGEPGALITELVAVGFVDEEDGVYSLHDWREHNPWVAEAEERSGKALMSKLAQVNKDIYLQLKGAGVESITREEYDVFRKQGTALNSVHAATAQRPQSAPLATAERPQSAPLAPAPSPSPSPNEREREVTGDAGTRAPAPDVSAKNGKKRKTFKPPSVEEVAAYCRERGNQVTPERFVDHYTANGWRVGGKAPMKDWRAAVRTWESNGRDSPPGSNGGGPLPPEQDEELQRVLKARAERKRKQTEAQANGTA